MRLNKEFNCFKAGRLLALCLGLGAGPAAAQDAAIKLNSAGGASSFTVVNSADAAVFAADSAGNTYAVGYSSANKFYGDGAALDNVSTHTLKIGDSYGGGKIFWLDPKAGHVLIAAPEDLAGKAQWGPQIVTGANLIDIYGGKANTLRISTMSAAASAARLCAAYTRTVDGVYYDDWYLPSKNELLQLYARQGDVGGFQSDDYYWSSTENGMIYAWFVFFANGNVGSTENRTASNYVRCIRGGPGLGDLPTNAQTVTGAAYLASTQTFTGANTFSEAVFSSFTVISAARLARSAYEEVNSARTLSVSDFGRTIIVNSAGAQVVTLPAVTADHIGATVTVAKTGAGQVTVTASGSAYIEHSPANGSIYCNTAGNAMLTLRLVTADRWVRVGGTSGWEIY